MDIAGYKLTRCVAENDVLFPEEILEEGRKHMRENATEHDIKVYPGVPHGNNFRMHRGERHTLTTEQDLL